MMHSCSERKMMIIWSMCLIFSLSYSILAIASPVKHLCLPDQRDALWDFKSEFYVEGLFSDKKTERWRNNTDCCFWDGISCDPKTGKVVELNLRYGALNGPMRSNSGLFRLQHLKSLVLDNNNIYGILPDSIDNLKYLSVLSLFECKFFGKIPSSIGNFSHLTDLDLSSNDFTGELPDSIGNLKYLSILSLGGCKFSGKIPPSIGNFSHLTDLDLSFNDFTGELPDSIGNLKRLARLELDYNKLSGKFPPKLFNLSELTWIDLDGNQFKGMLPSNMSSLSKLESFDISGNLFYGSIPSSLFMIPSLISLVLGRNGFSGSLAIGNISSPSKLQILYLGRNNFSGPIPGPISKLVGLLRLDLSYWNTGRGIVDFSIFSHLKSLDFLYLSYMNTRRTVDLSLISNLTSLGDLNLSGNDLKISPTLHLPSSIYSLYLSSCNISEFPKFLQTQTNLIQLFLSANQIEGRVPEWLWRLPLLCIVDISHNSFSGFEGSSDVMQRSVSIKVLDISSNTFKDPFPLLPNFMEYFLGSDNWFSGEIPTAICKLVNLNTLVLSNNNFSGSIPRCFENFRSTIVALHLQNNSLSGGFPEESMGDQLKSLDIGHNRLSGKLPKSLINCTRLEFLNIEDNRFNDTFPFWLRLLPKLQILVLRSNHFHGPISSPGVSLSFPKLRIFDISENRFSGVLPSDYFAGWAEMSVEMMLSKYTRGFSYYHQSVVLTNKGSKMELIGICFAMYKTLDLSGNRFQGDVPESIGSLKGLNVLNMSNNRFTGPLPQSLTYLTNLQSLDLSKNRLSGRIPPELGKLSFLESINFSCNRLEGPIPQGTQIQTQNSSSFADNPGLCGAPLQKTCGGGKEEARKQEQDEEKEEKDQVISWIAAAIAYVPGVFCGFVINHIFNFI